MNTPAKPLLVTIDGPAGAGKTTVSRLVAAELSYRYVDTGALYRCVALAALEAGILADDDAKLAALCQGLEIQMPPEGHGSLILLNGQDISGRIRTPEISMMASAVSARQVVREYLLSLQRQLGGGKAAVFEGRDMGTVVFPQADVKFYLDASPRTRALRRHKEMGEGASQTLAQVEADMRRRDANDSQRNLAPLKPAPDAIHIDATHLSVEQVVHEMLQHIRRRSKVPPDGNVV